MNSLIKSIILSDKKMSDLFNEIMDKDRCLWKKFSSPDDIFKWLNNFRNNNEIYLALVLANGILYYNKDEVRHLWRLILTNRVKRHLFNDIFEDGYLDSSDETDRRFINFIKNKCTFVGFGDIHKSGTHMIYPFKQAISGIISAEDIDFVGYDNFISSSLDMRAKRILFFLDDFIGTGNQAIDEWKTKITTSRSYINNKHLKFIYIVLTGFISGVRKIEQNTDMHVILGTQPMADSSRCFSNCSFIYCDTKERTMAKKIMENAGKILYLYPLGYENDQAAIAFEHNTPDNTLPVIWKRKKDGSWFPLFERCE